MDRQSAYTELLERYRPLVWRMCWFRARGNWDRCNDLVQEVSIALWLHFDALRPDATPAEKRAWIYWQCRSTLDLQRRLQKSSMQPLTTLLEETVADEDTRHTQEEIEELMAALSHEEQRLVGLYLEGYKTKEIADLMNLSHDTVYQRMHRAVGKARKAMLLTLLLLVASTVAIAVVPQWRQRVFSRTEEEEKPEEESVSPMESPSPTPVVPLEVPVDTVAPRPAWTPPDPLPYLTAPTDTTLPELPARKPEVGITYNDEKLVITGLVDGELVVIRNTKGVLVALKRAHSSTCTIELPLDPYSSVYSSYILQIGNRPDRIRIEL